jgi:hypothetical protein
MTRDQLISEVSDYLRSSVPEGEVDFDELPDVNEFMFELDDTDSAEESEAAGSEK